MLQAEELAVSGQVHEDNPRSGSFTGYSSLPWRQPHANTECQNLYGCNRPDSGKHRSHLMLQRRRPTPQTLILASLTMQGHQIAINCGRPMLQQPKLEATTAANNTTYNSQSAAYWAANANTNASNAASLRQQRQHRSHVPPPARRPAPTPRLLWRPVTPPIAAIPPRIGRIRRIKIPLLPLSP